MDKTGQDLLNLLFDKGETICVSDNEFGFFSVPLENATQGQVPLVSPNPDVPLRNCDSSNLIMVAINPINGYRRDLNVTAFRSFLVEIDIGTLPEQLATIEHLKMPFSAQIFSGNKSIHTVITLDEPLKDEKAYRFTAQWIFNIVPKVDTNCKNPSRSTRIPGAYREPDKKQRLRTIKKRVSQKELFDWLSKYNHLKPVDKPKREVPEGTADYNLLSPWARSMLVSGVVFRNGRNQTWFALAVDFALAGFPEETAIEQLSKHFSEEHDFKEKEFLGTITSGYKFVDERK